MLKTIEGTYENGRFSLEEIPKINGVKKVIITFLESDIEESVTNRQPGSLLKITNLKSYKLPADFNELLEDDLEGYI
jgi:hypothetical protein